MITDFAVTTDKGPCREVNQDAVFADCSGELGFFAVADGMGGHSDGEKASKAVIDELSVWWKSVVGSIDDYSLDGLGDDCIGSIQFVNGKLREFFSSNGTMGGTTIVILLIRRNEYLTISAGDSRIYSFDGKSINQITIDDVWENLPESKQEYSGSEMESDERYGKLTEAVGAYDELSIRKSEGRINGSVTFMLCSDGVYKYTSPRDLEWILEEKFWATDATGMIKKITKKVIKGGAGDNYSCIICKVSG